MAPGFARSPAAVLACSRTLGVPLCQLVLVGVLVLVCSPACHLAATVPVYAAVGVYAPVRECSPAVAKRSCTRRG